MKQTNLSLNVLFTLTLCISICFSAKGEITLSTKKQLTLRENIKKGIVKQEGNKVYIVGLEDKMWGGTSEKQNSVMGALSAAFDVIDQDIAFTDLMGIGGAGFRLQFMWCGSSPHSYCGYNCAIPALDAYGYTLTEIHTFDMKTKAEIPKGIEEAKTKIIDSINAGYAVLADSEESSLIVGYVNNGESFLMRRYSAEFSDTKIGYNKMKKWPWSVGILTPQPITNKAKEIYKNSIMNAITLAETPKQGDYDSGFSAFTVWSAELKDDKSFAKMDMKELRNKCRVNAWIYGCLNTARKAASQYLINISSNFDNEVKVELQAAAKEYAALADKIGKGEKGLPGCWFMFPWNLKGAKNWTSQMRHKQAKMLINVLKHEKKAIKHLKKAYPLM
jgi:hypothetical protein